MGAERWRMVSGWAGDDEELGTVLDKYSDVMGAVVYTRHGSDEPLAMGLIMVENWNRRIASFHGGGWHSPWASYDCAKLLIAAMMAAGWHVRTSVAPDNRRARRFVLSLGMEHYRTVKGRHLYRLPETGSRSACR